MQAKELRLYEVYWAKRKGHERESYEVYFYRTNLIIQFSYFFETALRK